MASPGHGPETVRSTVGNIGGIIARTVSVIVGLEGLRLEPGSLGALGGSVALSSGMMRDRQATALRAVMARLLDVDVLVDRWVPSELPAAEDPEPRNIWTGPAGAELAAHALADSARGTGRPGSVRTILGYLALTGLARSSEGVPTDNPADFAEWLDGEAGHQAGLGLIGVFRGAAGGLIDVPGGVRDGDVVIIESGPGASRPSTVLGIVANRGKLYNNGPIQPDFEGFAMLRVYRPISGRTDV